MRDPKKRAISNACHWLNKCYDLGVTAEEVIAQSAASPIAASRAASRKENEGEKRTSPLNPSLEKRAKQEKAPPPPPARACEGKGTGGGRTRNPTFEEVDQYASDCGIPQDFARAWFDAMNQKNQGRRWHHPKTGKPLKHWQSYLSIWYKRRDEFDPPKEHEAVKEEFHSTALEELMPWLK